MAGLVVAAGLGLVNGALVALVNLPSLAVTLGTLAAFQGLAFVVLSGEGVAEFPQGYLNLGGGYIRQRAPVALVVLVAATLVLGTVLHATRFGRYLFAIGNNREAARLSGVPATRVRVTIFVISGLMAGSPASPTSATSGPRAPTPRRARCSTSSRPSSSAA